MTFAPGTKVFYIGYDDATEVLPNSVGHVVGLFEDSELIEVLFDDGSLPGHVGEATQIVLTNCIFETE